MRKRLSENEKKFRSYLKKYHPDKYEELLLNELKWNGRHWTMKKEEEIIFG